MTTAMQEALDRALNNIKPAGIGSDAPPKPVVHVQPQSKPQERTKRPYRSVSLKDKLEIADLCRKYIVDGEDGKRYVDGWSDKRVVETFGADRILLHQVQNIRRSAVGELVMGRRDTGKGFAGKRLTAKTVEERFSRIEEKLELILEALHRNTK